MIRSLAEQDYQFSKDAGLANLVAQTTTPIELFHVYIDGSIVYLMLRSGTHEEKIDANKAPLCAQWAKANGFYDKYYHNLIKYNRVQEEEAERMLGL